MCSHLPRFIFTAAVHAYHLRLVDFVRLLKLAVIERRIRAFFRQQFFVIALLNNISVFHKQDRIRVADRRKPVGDDQRSV